MFSQLPTKERIAYAAIASLAVGGIAYMGFSNRRPATIVFENLPAESQPIASKPENAPAARPQRPNKAQTPKKKVAPSTVVSLNSATAEQLESLPGIGPVTAQKILAYRKQHGKFSSVDELIAVKGIGPKKLAAIRPLVKL